MSNELVSFAMLAHGQSLRLLDFGPHDKSKQSLRGEVFVVMTTRHGGKGIVGFLRRVENPDKSRQGAPFTIPGAVSAPAAKPTVFQTVSRPSLFLDSPSSS